MNKMARFFRSPRAALAAVSLLAAGVSHAALDSTVTEALTGAKTDGLVIGAAVLVVLVAIAGFKYLRRAL